MKLSGWIIDLNESPEPPKIIDAEANAVDGWR
jgi:hypothetical protein